MALKKCVPSKNPITRHGSSSSSSFSSSLPSRDIHDSKSQKDFDENFSDKAIHSECQIILSDFLDTSLPRAFSSQGWESLNEKPLRCPGVFIQEFYSNIHAIDTFVPQFITVFKGTHIVVTLELISKVLHVPKVVRPNYPSHPRLHSISRDELTTRFCEMAMVWGGLQNFTTHDFAKGPRILNMVMTFDLTPWSYYNTITKPRAHFLFSLLERLSIDFLSHMIDIYQDIASRDKLIFPSTITRILTHMHIAISSTPIFFIMGVINKESIQMSDV